MILNINLLTINKNNKITVLQKKPIMNNLFLKNQHKNLQKALIAVNMFKKIISLFININYSIKSQIQDISFKNKLTLIYFNNKICNNK
jgi:hypothetical protein